MDAPQQSSWFNRNKAWVIPVGCLFAVFGGTCVACAGCFGVAAVQSGGAITQELAQVQRLPAEAAAAASGDESVKKLLGEPVKAGEMVAENYRNNNGVGEMRFTLPLTGSKQPGVATAKATRAPEAGWKLRHLEVKAQNGDTVTVLDVPEPEGAPTPQP